MLFWVRAFQSFSGLIPHLSPFSSCCSPRKVNKTSRPRWWTSGCLPGEGNKERPSKQNCLSATDRPLSKSGHAMAEGQWEHRQSRPQGSGSWSPLLNESQVSALQFSIMSFTYVAEILWLSKWFRELIQLKQQPDKGKGKRRRKEEEGRGGGRKKKKKKRRGLVAGMDYILIFTAETALLAQHKYN